MKTHIFAASRNLVDFQGYARRCAEVGFAGLNLIEAARTAYLGYAAAALSGAKLDLATGIAVAFPRSPMVTAQTAWELADVSRGRFRLGLGAQVKAQVERRYSAPYSPPGPRLREYVLALRAIYDAFQNDAPLRFAGDYYEFSWLGAMFSPGPLEVGPPPVDLTALNPWMLRAAGEVADGLHVHPLHNPVYLRETMLPELQRGAAAGGRDLRGFTLFVPFFTAVGDTEDEVARRREICRGRLAFYGSVPTYQMIFDQLGWPQAPEEMRQAQRQAARPPALPDELLDSFIVESTWSGLAKEIATRCVPLAGFDVKPILYLAGMDLDETSREFEQFGQVAVELAALDVPGPHPTDEVNQ